MTLTIIVQENNFAFLPPGVGSVLPVTDVSIAAGLATIVNSPIVLVTGYVSAGSNLDKSRVIEIQVEYESEGAQTLIFEHSSNGGASWSAFATKTIAATSRPTILSVVQSITGHGLQLRLRSVTIGQFRLLAFVPRVVQEARVFP